MKGLLLSSVILAAMSAPAAAATLVLQVFDNGVSEGTVVSTTGTAAIRVSTDPAFDIIDVSASGVPFLPHADLSSVTLSVTSAAITTAHTLTIDVFQTGVVAGSGAQTQSTFTVNNLIGSAGIGPSTESTFVNGTTSSLGTLLATHTFAAGTVRDSVGPIAGTMSSPLFADAHQYITTFTGPNQSSNDTIQLTTSAIPESSTWMMLFLGAGFMGLLGFRKRSGKFLEA